MAFFKFRKGDNEQSATSVSPESIEAIRTRAKHRLIGAAVLVLLGVVGFPLLFDKQPRPIAVDIPIEIPDRGKVKPLAIPEPPAAVKVQEAAIPATVPAASAMVAEVSKIKLAPAEKQADTPVEKPVEKAIPVAVQNAEASKTPQPSNVTDSVKNAATVEGRFVVQVGAFSDVSRAREVRLKVEHIGLKTYTQVVETKDGRRIRVRVGPFADRVDAEKAAEKIKKLALPAAILNL